MEIKVRNLDAQEERVETGVVKFGDDWPGVFIRGDNAFNYAHALDRVLASSNPCPIYDDTIKGLIDLLRSTDINR
jgi:hypothetical protein